MITKAQTWSIQVWDVPGCCWCAITSIVRGSLEPAVVMKLQPLVMSQAAQIPLPGHWRHPGKGNFWPPCPFFQKRGSYNKTSTSAARSQTQTGGCKQRAKPLSICTLTTDAAWEFGDLNEGFYNNVQYGRFKTPQSSPLHAAAVSCTCTPPIPIVTIFLLFFQKKFEKWRCFLRAHSFERSAQDRDRTLVSDPQCSVLHNRRLRRVSAAVAFRRRNTRKERSRTQRGNALHRVSV